jgi:acetyl esterase/lipase
MTGQRAPVVQVVVQRQPVDEAFVTELVEDEAGRLGIRARTTWVDGLDQLLGMAQDLAQAGQQLLLVTRPGTPDLTGLPAACWGSTARVDLSLRDTDQTPGLLGHIQGRGVDGLRWALRSVHYRGRRTVLTTAYGSDADQVGELRLADGGSRLQPVVVLLHGGFWRSRWNLDLMDALAVDLAERGLASWNLEYRRPDVHRWSDTVDDVLAGIRHVTELAQELPLDSGRLALVGHSAGGQLAAQAARALNLTVGPRPRLVVQLAGLVDLVETHRRDLGNGAVPSALGGTPDEVPSAYDSASPMSHPGVGGDQLVVVGRSDSPDLREMSRRYVRAAQASGDTASLLEDEGDHFTVIDPASGLWHRAAAAIQDALST